jgi:ABC-type bacteriocin/lantibiotic exporter with double-glycine peptidase domain
MTEQTAIGGRSRLDDALQRIERLLRAHATPVPSGDDLAALLRVAATHLDVPAAAVRQPVPGEPLPAAIARLSEEAGLLARRIKIDAEFLAAGDGPVLCSLVSDGCLVALVRERRRWMVYAPSRSQQPSPLDDATRMNLPTAGHLLLPAFPARPLTQKEVLLFGWRRAKGSIFANLLLNGLAGLILVLFPMLTGAIIEVALPGREAALLAAVIGFMLVLCAMHSVVKIASDLTVLRLQGLTGSMLRSAMIDRSVRIPQADHAGVPPAIMALAVRAVESWRRATWSLGLRIASAVAISLPSLIMMLVLAPVSGLCICAAIILVLGASLHLAMRQRAAMLQGDAGPGSWIVMAYETMLNVETVRASAAEGSLFVRWIESFAPFQERQLASGRVGAYSAGVLAGLEGFLILVAIAAIVVSGAGMQAETAISFIMATGTVVTAVATLIAGAGEIGGLTMQQRLAHPLLTATPAASAKGQRPADPQGTLQAIGVTYRHAPDHAPTLEDIDLVAEPGEYVGITGVTGSGKTTLLDILLGLRTPQAGAVYLDGVEIRKLDMRQARQRIGVVGQGARLFPGTLRDNVCLGTSLPDDQIWTYLDMAGVGREIAALPLGLGTIVGDNNQMFSGGQIQRILLARALAMRPKLIVLDEATSAIDSATQADVIKEIRGLGITVIAVAHRLETLKACDRVYVLDRGRIVQAGTYAGLVEESGRFRQLVEAARCA